VLQFADAAVMPMRAWQPTLRKGMVLSQHNSGGLAAAACGATAVPSVSAPRYMSGTGRCNRRNRHAVVGER